MLTLSLVFVLDSQCIDSVFASVNDKWGNEVFDNGTIAWVDIPVGNKSYVTTDFYDDGGLRQLFAFSRSFINTVQPNGFPFGKLLSGYRHLYHVSYIV